MTDDNPTDAEEALEEAKNQTRHETDPAASSHKGTVSLVDAVADAYADLDAGDIPENLTIRDENLAALFAGLDETGQLGEITSEAARSLGRDEPDAESKAAALRLLVRVGLDEVAPESLDAGVKGFEQHRDQQDFEF